MADISSTDVFGVTYAPDQSMSACYGGINPQVQKKSIASLSEPIAYFFPSQSSLTYLDECKLHAEGIGSLMYDW